MPLFPAVLYSLAGAWERPLGEVDSTTSQAFSKRAVDMQIVNTEKLTKEFGELVAVNELGFSVEKGQVLGLIGPNGAGKTTLLKMLSSIVRPTRGTIEVMGQSLAEEYLSIRKKIGYLPDFFNLYSDLKIEECLEFFAKAYGVDPAESPKRIEQTLTYIGLADKRGDYIQNLSRGMVQRLGIGVSLVHDPSLFLLDEPASGLDPRARIELRDLLKRLSSDGKTIVISSHILTELSGFCTHIAVMNKGRLVLLGSVDDIEAQMSGARRVAVTVVDRVDEAVSCIEEETTAHNVQFSENTVTFDTSMTREALSALNARLVQKGLLVCGLKEEKRDLEDLFMKITTDTQAEE
jgi:ABC-2 type transport system ATP-binding protein